MQECRSVPTHMVAFVHVIYCCFLSFCRPVTILLPYVIVIIDGRSDRSNNIMSSCSQDRKKFWVLVSIKYFLKIMYYMESGSTGDSMISVNLVMINVLIFAYAYFHLDSSTSPRKTDSEILYIIIKSVYFYIVYLNSLMFSQVLYVFLNGFWYLF